jgi:hypothetical protein
MKLRRAVGVVLVVAGLLGLGYAAALAEAEDDDEFSASRLGDDLDGGSMWEMLTPEEKAAAERSGVAWLDRDQATAKAEAGSAEEAGGVGKKLDKAGKVGFSIFAVALSLAAAAAPFLLF